MAVPARRTSKTKKRMRRTHLKKVARTITTCPKCGAAIQPHRACTSCGFYKGKDVLSKNVEETEEVKEAKVEAPKKTTKKKETKKEEAK